MLTIYYWCIIILILIKAMLNSEVKNLFKVKITINEITILINPESN